MKDATLSHYSYRPGVWKKVKLTYRGDFDNIRIMNCGNPKRSANINNDASSNRKLKRGRKQERYTGGAVQGKGSQLRREK
jgi:hypothetical protein